MKKLDSAYLVLIATHVVGAGAWLVTPFAGLDDDIETFTQFTVVAVAALIALAIYGTLVAASANKAANYDKIAEALKDVNGDVRTFSVLLGLSVVMVTVPATCYGLLTLIEGIPIPNIGNDIIWCYSTSLVFVILLTALRNYERRLTMKNIAERFYEMNPTRLAPSA